jgi:hypothetical protein
VGPLTLFGNCIYKLVTTHCDGSPGVGWFKVTASFEEHLPSTMPFMEGIAITFHEAVSHPL